MKKLTLLFGLSVLLFSCSTPEERVKTVEDYGVVIYRQYPFTVNINESFIVRDTLKGIDYFIDVYEDGSLGRVDRIWH